MYQLGSDTKQIGSLAVVNSPATNSDSAEKPSAMLGTIDNDASPSVPSATIETMYNPEARAAKARGEGLAHRLS